jgi:hypothetical protein
MATFLVRAENDSFSFGPSDDRLINHYLLSNMRVMFSDNNQQQSATVQSVSHVIAAKVTSTALEF